ncbi:MAG: hypothetical protein HY363_04770 [Candidatus Aenigmarchaeota archaeon]|nr:hypothetical protein [Candidatus Aenigmarchaeota archaeon]
MVKSELLTFGLVAITAVLGIILILSETQTTGQVYGGALKETEYPYLENRPAKGVPVTPEGITVASEEEAYSQAVPYRTYNRVPGQIPSALTSCGQGKIEVSTNILRTFKETYPNAQCTDYIKKLDSYCCSAKGLNLRY